MLSIIIKLLIWVKYKIYKRFYSYYIEVSDSVKTQVLISACTACTVISTITISDLRYIDYTIYLRMLRLMFNTIAITLLINDNIQAISIFRIDINLVMLILAATYFEYVNL